MAQLPKLERLDALQIQGVDLPPDFERGLTNLVDSLNEAIDTIEGEFSNNLSGRTADIGGGGAGPISVAVSGVTASSIVTASIQSSTNTVAVAKVTATATGFDILFTADPGASCFVNYQINVESRSA